MSNPLQEIKIVKLFASSEYKLRNRAYKVISKLLKFEFGSGARQLSAVNLVAIWKGLYMWLYMQDKPILHEEVVGKVCGLLNQIEHPQVALEFIKTFFITLQREWKKISFLCMDKYYMLTRDFFAACLSYLSTREDLVEQFVSNLASGVLNGVIDKGIEFKLHFIDILLDELIKAESSCNLTTSVMIVCVESILQSSRKSPYVMKIKKRVIERLFPLVKENKLKLNMSEFGRNIFEMTERGVKLAKTKKFCYSLCKRIADYVSTATETVDNGDSLMVDSVMVDSVTVDSVTVDSVMVDSVNKDTLSMETDSKEEKMHMSDRDVGEDVAVTEEAAEEQHCVNSDTETESTEMEESTVPPVTFLKASPMLMKKNGTKKKKNNNNKKNGVVAVKAAIGKTPGEVEVDSLSPASKRKVTFGKKYTKKFKKTDVEISVSQGVVKNTIFKSILKKS